MFSVQWGLGSLYPLNYQYTRSHWLRSPYRRASAPSSLLSGPAASSSRALQSYIIYRIASSLLILGFFFFSVILLGLEMPTWAIIVINITNDASVMATSFDLVSRNQWSYSCISQSIPLSCTLTLRWQSHKHRSQQQCLSHSPPLGSGKLKAWVCFAVCALGLTS